MPSPDSIGTDYDLRCLSVMQHYGVPTRLLDWTSDFWTAVYFACAGDPSKEAELWRYDRDIFSDQLNSRVELASSLQPSIPGQPFPPKEPDLLLQRGGNLIVELDPQITPRMKQQFAHYTFSSDVFADHGPLLDQMPKTSDGMLLQKGGRNQRGHYLVKTTKIQNNARTAVVMIASRVKWSTIQVQKSTI